MLRGGRGSLRVLLTINHHQRCPEAAVRGGLQHLSLPRAGGGLTYRTSNENNFAGSGFDDSCIFARDGPGESGVDDGAGTISAGGGAAGGG